MSVAPSPPHRRTQEQLEKLRATLYDPDAETVERRIELSRKFHEVMLGAADSPIIEALIGPIFLVLYERLVDRVPRVGGEMKISGLMEADHQLIFDAIAAGDEEGARAEMRIHLQKLRPSSR
ncbi:MAG: FadR/GntR family transcriptional regulator [Mycobacteriales bacterium]